MLSSNKSILCLRIKFKWMQRKISYKALTESRITVVEITIIESSYSLMVGNLES